MIDTINIAGTGSSKTGATSVLTSTKTSLQGTSEENTDDSLAGGELFNDLIQQLAGGSGQGTENTELLSGGNELPLLNDFPDSTAQDDRHSATPDFNITEQFSVQLPEQNRQIIQAATVLSQPVTLDKDINIEAGLNVLSSSLRQLINIEPNVDAKNNQPTNSTITAINNVAINNTVEKPLIQQPDVPQLSAQQPELISKNSQLLNTVINQQQVLPDSQTSLLLKTLSVQGESSIDTPSIIVNPPLNNLSAISQQSPVQAEIVETFARPGWSQGMGKQILWMVNQNIGSAEIRLNPAHLGPIEVLIDMSEDQVNVSLSSRHAVVREAMEMALPKLREMFESNGLNLADTDISKHSFAEQREQKTANNSNITGDNVDQTARSEITEQAIKQIPVSTGMVDYYI